MRASSSAMTTLKGVLLTSRAYRRSSTLASSRPPAAPPDTPTAEGAVSNTAQCGFESHSGHPCDVARHRNDSEPTSGFGVVVFARVSGCGSGRLAGWLVVAAGVESQVA